MHVGRGILTAGRGFGCGVARAGDSERCGSRGCRWDQESYGLALLDRKVGRGRGGDEGDVSILIEVEAVEA
jgi:hypothetical protein